ncbi:MAG: metallophosphoesterase, partial [Bacteroidia bacterium]|nr:metallophosphoesterase [Bacteroidia bacterium]
MLKRYTFIFFFVISLQKIAATQSGPDSVTVLASHQYKNPTTFKKIFIGSNYRKEWSTPVTMHLFDIKGNHREFEIVKTGGGDQTTSLHLDDKNERDWVLRSVDKNIEKVLPPVLRKTFIKKIVQDIISASYPYAGLTVSYLSNAAKVVTGSQQLYFVPDDPALGQYRSVMANRVCILVNRQPVSKNDLETGEMMEKLSEDNLYSVDQKEFLKARLIDWLVADWDRHAGQLRWLPHEVKGRIFFYPLLRDRDQAFFYSNGLLVKLVTLFAMPYLKGFKKMSTGIKQLSKKLRKMDEVFLNELDRNDWQRIIKSFQQNVTNRV